jgi:hypothetical protein
MINDQKVIFDAKIEVITFYWQHPHTKKHSFMFMKVKGNIQSIFSLNLNRVFQYSGNWFFYWQLFATWLKTIIKKSMWLIQRIFVKTKCAKVVPNLKGDFISIFQIYTICFKPITKYSRILKICLLSFLTCSQI